MGKQPGASSFIPHLHFIHQFSIKGILLAAFAIAACLNPTVSLAQQGKLPQATEPPNIIRLRQEWFYQQRAYPHKHIPPGARIKALQQLRHMESAQRRQFKGQTSTTAVPSTGSTTQAATLSSTQWTLIGPQPSSTPFAFNPVSGRVTALAVDPTNANTVYLGGAEGGVWKTTDGGTTWTPLTDNQSSLAVGSIAIDPENHQTLYVGTGEEDFALNNYAGAGILKSTDGGSTWTQLAGPFTGPFASQSPYCGGAYIGSLAVDPGNSQVLLAGALFQCNAGSGIYRSTNGGTSWTLVFGSATLPRLVTGLVFDPTNGNNVYAALASNPNTGPGGIWKSTNAGLTWTLDDGSGTTAFPGGAAGRISLAIAPSSPTTLYAGAASLTSNSVSLLGVYKSTNGGAAWTQLTSAPQYCSPDPSSGQCFFDNVVAVSPTDPNTVLLGGSAGTSGYSGTLYLSLDGGSSWTDITQDSVSKALHPDMHAIAFSNDGSKMYVGNDGGVWSTSLSASGAGTWADLNQSLALTQFYPGMSLDPIDPNIAFAGSQDNGVQEYSGSRTWSYVGCGDGGQTAFNYSDLNTLYIGCQYVPPNTNPDGSTADFLYRLTANPSTGVAADNGIDGTDRGAFIPPLTLDPSSPNTLYFGTYRIYQTTDGGANWKPLSSDLTTNGQNILSTISAITVAPSDSNTVYVGTNDGFLWRTNDANIGGSFGLVNNGTPRRSVTAIAVSPTNAQTAYSTFSGYSGFNSDTLGHVFETFNGGTTWTDISSNLPNVPVNDIVVDPDFSNTLYAATDIGVFSTTNGGTSWAPLGTGLPTVVIMSLKLHRATRILRAASYGRSAWDIQLPAPAGAAAVFSTPTIDFAPELVGTTSSARSVTLTNNGSSTLSISSIAASSGFAETNTCGASVAAGANCTISVTFTPAALGEQTGTVTLNDNAASGSPQTISLNGKGYSGAVTLSPASLAFSNQLVGTTSAAQTVTLTNSGTTPLTLTALTSPSEFKATSDCPISTTGTLAAGASCHIQISFAPTTSGTMAEQVTLTDSAGDSPQAVTVTGTGIQAVVTLSAAILNFGDQPVGSSTQQTVKLTNTGTSDLAISQVSVATPYSETDNCPRSPSTIPPQGSCTLTVTFSPTTWGLEDGMALSLQDNALYGSQTVVLFGSGYSGAITLSPASVNFGSVRVGQTSAQSVTLTSSGSTPLYLSSFSSPNGSGGPVSENDNCPFVPSSLPAGSSCTLTFSYAPTVAGGMARFLNIDDSAAGYHQTIALTGSASAPDFSIVNSSGTASVAQGGSTNYTLSLTPLGGFNQPISLACTGAPTRASCTVTPSSVTLDGTHAQNVQVAVTTTAPTLVPPGPRGGPPAPGGLSLHPWWVALLMLLVALAVELKRRRRLPLLAGAVLLAALALSCGGGGGGGGGTASTQGTPPGNYTMTITATSGSLTHQTTAPLIVQ